MNSNKTLLFSIATNGYAEIYKDYLDSHRNYAAKYGYKYVAFTKSPPSGISGTNSAWLKVSVILQALKKGYGTIFFIDSDALIRPYTPAIGSILRPNKYIYMSVESDGRFNSGVIIVKNSACSIRFFEKLLLRADVPGFLLPRSDRNLYENGHVINIAKRSQIVQVIDPKWNYNYNTILLEGEEEYIYHGRDSWQKKPRSRADPMNVVTSLKQRMKEGSRYFLLKSVFKFYENEYHF